MKIKKHATFYKGIIKNIMFYLGIIIKNIAFKNYYPKGYTCYIFCKLTFFENFLALQVHSPPYQERKQLLQKNCHRYQHLISSR